MTTTYPIGDVARRTGLAVSAIRFYSDEGIVPPTGIAPNGHRLYDLEAIARLELIRTLRDLGAGLPEIRRLIDGTHSLRDLLAEHLDLVTRQERDLRARRAVLSALTAQDAPATRAALMHRVVTMPDAEREHLVDAFWDEVAADLPDAFAARLRDMRPHLPADPTAAQLEAWLELCDLLRDDEYRAALRADLDDYASAPFGPRMTAAATQDFMHGPGARLAERLIAAHHCGLPADSPHARQLAGQLVDGTTDAIGLPADPGLAGRLASRYRDLATVHDTPHPGPHDRYLALVAAINATPPDNRLTLDVDLAALGSWISAALSPAQAP